MEKREGYLRRHLVLSKTVIDKLHDYGIITEVSKNLMMKQPTQYQLDTLMNALKKCDIRTFQKFLKLLKDINNNWIAEAVLDTPLGDTLFRDKIKFRRLDDFDVYSRDRFLEDLEDISRRPLVRQRSAILDRSSIHRDEVYYLGQTVPRQIHGLHVTFDEQRNQAERTLTMLKQEELAIRDMLSQNARDQYYVRKNQRTLYEIDYRLQELQYKSRELELRPPPKIENARERLLRLHKMN